MTLRFLLLLAVRDRLFTAMIIALAGVSLLASFIGGTSVVERNAASIVFTGYAARLLVVGGIVLFAVFQLRRLMDSQEIALILSKPRSRLRFVVECTAAYAAIALALSVVATAAVAVAAPTAVSASGLAQWGLGLALEGALMAAFAVFVGLTLDSAIVAVLLAVAFNALTRLVGVLLAITQSEFRAATDVNAVLDTLVTGMRLVLPRLDQLAETRWLLYGADASTGTLFAFGQTGLYVGVVLAAAVFDFAGRRL